MEDGHSNRVGGLARSHLGHAGAVDACGLFWSAASRQDAHCRVTTPAGAVRVSALRDASGLVVDRLGGDGHRDTVVTVVQRDPRLAQDRFDRECSPATRLGMAEFQSVDCALGHSEVAGKVALAPA